MTCLGVLDRGERGDDNETGLKEGRGIEMSTTVLSIYTMHALPFRFENTYPGCLPAVDQNCVGISLPTPMTY